ncbi:MAG TPA: hypothetical protein VKV26_24395 [Dehalococcoidia bacterium]|nr:hypothetical protein [Dehalococcoidia bacterium]
MHSSNGAAPALGALLLAGAAGKTLFVAGHALIAAGMAVAAPTLAGAAWNRAFRRRASRLCGQSAGERGEPIAR